MFTQNRLGTVWSLVLVAAVTAACGDSKSTMNPAAPSAVVVEGSQSAEAGGEWSTTGKPDNPGGNGKGNGNGNGGDNGNGKGKNDTPTTTPGTQTPTNTTPTTTRKVEIEGLISSKAGDSITVNAQSVTVPTSCVIRHGNTQFQFSDLKVGDRVHVKGMRSTTGTGATATTKIEASEVKLQNPGDGGDDDDEEEPTDLVSVSATDAVASETGPDLGTFRFTRSGNTSAVLIVTFTVSGTATNGSDYQGVPTTVTFAAGQTTVDLFVVPLADGSTEGSETVIVTVQDGATYSAGAPASATVTIAG
jgi:hypothetical protein